MTDQRRTKGEVIIELGLFISLFLPSLALGADTGSTGAVQVPPAQAPAQPTTEKKGDSTPRALIHFGDTDPVALAIALAALVVSVVALWLTWLESQRNNSPIVKVKACRGYKELSCQSGPQPSQEFVIALHNRGISLWDMKVYLEFRGENLIGGGAYEMSPRSKSERPLVRLGPLTTEPTPEKHPAEFARGMIAEFEITSRKLYPGVTIEDFVAWFSQLTDARRQQARITIHSQDFQVCAIPVCGLWDRLMGRWSRLLWNRLASRINSRFDKVIENPYGSCGQPELDNAPMLIPGKVLPTFLTLEHQLMAFAWYVRQQKQQPAGQQPTEPRTQG